jgi:hypothetical protein
VKAHDHASALPVREGDITRGVVDYLALIGAWGLKIHGHLGQRAGVPDVLACVRARFVAIEVKRPGGKLSPRQIDELAAIVQAGGVGLVVDDVTELVAALERLEAAHGG